ncbi:MAG: ATP-binding protein, partial [Povalibacter sp.]
ELLTNALQHSSELADGTLRIELKALVGSRVQLTVHEPRLPKADAPARNAGTLGLQLVTMLTEQLSGTLESNPDQGRTTVTFPLVT